MRDGFDIMAEAKNGAIFMQDENGEWHWVVPKERYIANIFLTVAIASAVPFAFAVTFWLLG